MSLKRESLSISGGDPSVAESTVQTDEEGMNAPAKKPRAQRACVQCRVVHRTCDMDLPCSRCKSRGLAHLCSYSDPKKRGPRAKTADNRNDTKASSSDLIDRYLPPGFHFPKPFADVAMASAGTVLFPFRPDTALQPPLDMAFQPQLNVPVFCPRPAEQLRSSPASTMSTASCDPSVEIELAMDAIYYRHAVTEACENFKQAHADMVVTPEQQSVEDARISADLQEFIEIVNTVWVPSFACECVTDRMLAYNQLLLEHCSLSRPQLESPTFTPYDFMDPRAIPQICMTLCKFFEDETLQKQQFPVRIRTAQGISDATCCIKITRDARLCPLVCCVLIVPHDQCCILADLM